MVTDPKRMLYCTHCKRMEETRLFKDELEFCLMCESPIRTTRPITDGELASLTQELIDHKERVAQVKIGVR
jgi:hypothetical protein